MRAIWCFDFDGTLVDIEARYTNIYKKLMADFGLQPLKDYWEMRRGGLSEKDVLAVSGLPITDINEYDENRELLLENPLYLNYDRLFDGVVEMLTFLKSRRIETRIVTHRSNCKLVFTEIEILGVKDLISSCKCTKDKGKIGLAMINDQVEALSAKKNYFISLKQEYHVIVVGDTISDIIAAKESGAVAIGLASGLQSFKMLEQANPNYLFNTIGDLFLSVKHDYVHIPAN